MWQCWSVIGVLSSSLSAGVSSIGQADWFHDIYNDLSDLRNSQNAPVLSRHSTGGPVSIGDGWKSLQHLNMGAYGRTVPRVHRPLQCNYNDDLLSQ